jgi:hypothetical protein
MPKNKKFLFVILFLFFALYPLKNASAYYYYTSDPLIQFNQSGQPFIAFGNEASGSYNDLNVMGEGLTYNIAEAENASNYSLEIWHNSSQIADGNILYINATVNFTSNISKNYSLQIYDFASSQWTSVGCDFGTVLVDAPTQWWCNETSGVEIYNSSDRRIRIRLFSIEDANPGLLEEDYVQYYVGYESGYLEVSMINPNSSLVTNVIQNFLFNVNASVVCRNGPCGEVFGTVEYNLSSSNPDTPVNVTSGDKPFYIQEVLPVALKSCDVLYKDQSCQLNWTLNTTGDTSTYWKIGILFNSSYDEVQNNSTANATTSIIPCTSDIEVSWMSIDFGLLNPSSGPYDAPGNLNNGYKITVKEGSCNSNLYIRGVDLENNDLNSVIGVGNVTWSNESDDYQNSFTLSNMDQLIKSNVPQKTSITTWYWLNVPSVYAGFYNGTITISGVKYV